MAVVSAVPCLQVLEIEAERGPPGLARRRLVGSDGQRVEFPGGLLVSAALWAASAASRRASNPSPLSMAARARRSVSS